VGFAPSV